MLPRGGFFLLLGVGLTAAFVPFPGAKVSCPVAPLDTASDLLS